MRVNDWQLRLEALVTERANRPFEWGVSDCCMWAADVVLAVTGVDPAAQYRGTYANEDEARALMDGERGLLRKCADVLGEKIVPGLAQPGDIGLVMQDGAPMLVAYAGCWLGQGPLGLVPIDADAVRLAWRCE